MHKLMLSFFVVLIGSITVFSVIFLTRPIVTQVTAREISAIIPSPADPKPGASSLTSPTENVNSGPGTYKPTSQPSTGIGSMLSGAVNWVKNLFTPKSSAPGGPKFDNTAPGEPKFDNTAPGGPKNTPASSAPGGPKNNTTPTSPSGGMDNSSGTGTSNQQNQTNESSDSQDNSNSESSNEDSNSSSGGSSSGGSNSGGSNSNSATRTPTTPTVFQPFVSPIALTNASTLVCQTGFARPLLFGVSPDGASAYEDASIANLKKAGSTMATVPLNWDVIQPSGPQNYVAAEMVNFPIGKAVQTGLTVVVNVSGTPNWATGNSGLAPGKAQPNKANDVVNREFKELVTQAVNDNKAKVKYWSYWNEPNGCMSSKGDCGYTEDSLEDFAYWHKVFYDTVKAADPSAKVIFGNLDFTGPNVNFIRDAHNLDDIDIQYDYLGINAYNKTKNTPLPIEWVKAAYDAQPSNYKKPIWLNEWGFDRIWWGCEDGACRTQARLDIARLVEDGFKKIVAADYIFAAQYHNLRDSGGDYGLWDNDAPRPAGVKFKEFVDATCAPIPAGSNPTPTTAACVTNSNDLGSNKLKRGQQVTFSSVANVPINRFKYNFYVPGSAAAPVKAFCVKGLPQQPNDGCPSGSGQLVIESRGENEGSVQAADWIKLPSNQVLQSLWKGNIGSNRRVPFDANFGGTASINWNFSNYVSNLSIGGPFRPTAEIGAMATYSTNTISATMEIWRNNQMWYNVVRFGDNGDLNWGQADGWKLYKDFNSAADKNFWPGTGLVTARSSFVGKDNKLWHIYWRGDEEWARGVPIVNGFSDSTLLENQPNKGWIRTRTLSELHTATTTTGKVQALSHLVMPDGSVQEQIWINNQVRKRTISQTASGPNFTTASPYQVISSGGLTPPTDQADSISVEYAKLFQQDANLKKVPDFLQINTTFETVDGKTIGNHSSCVTWLEIDKSIPGDLDGNCLVDIYDYNVLMEQQGKTNCAYNLTGDCTIDANDITHFLPLYGNKCPAN